MKRKLFVNISTDVNTGVRFRYYSLLCAQTNRWNSWPTFIYLRALSSWGSWNEELLTFASVQTGETLGKYFMWVWIEWWLFICYRESFVLERQWNCCGLYSQVRAGYKPLGLGSREEKVKARGALGNLCAVPCREMRCEAVLLDPAPLSRHFSLTHLTHPAFSILASWQQYLSYLYQAATHYNQFLQPPVSPRNENYVWDQVKGQQ